MTRSAAEVPEPVGDYYDEDGFVFRGVPASEVKAGWIELTQDQQQHVQPLTKFDERRFEANEARENEQSTRLVDELTKEPA